CEPCPRPASRFARAPAHSPAPARGRRWGRSPRPSGRASFASRAARPLFYPNSASDARIRPGCPLAAAGHLALGDAPEAHHLPQVEAVARERRDRRELEPPDQAMGHERPALLVADEVAADLEVALPSEVGGVVVRGQA